MPGPKKLFITAMAMKAAGASTLACAGSTVRAVVVSMSPMEFLFAGSLQVVIGTNNSFMVGTNQIAGEQATRAP